MNKYQVDERDLSRFNLYKINSFITEIRNKLKYHIMDNIVREDLENILIYLEDTRNYIMDMRKEKSE